MSSKTGQTRPPKRDDVDEAIKETELDQVAQEPAIDEAGQTAKEIRQTKLRRIQCLERLGGAHRVHREVHRHEP